MCLIKCCGRRFVYCRLYPFYHHIHSTGFPYTVGPYDTETKEKMFASTLFTALFCAGLVVAHDGQTHGHLQPREETNETNTVEITTFGRSQNSTGGQAQVAAAGDLSPFGEIGVGCGINWQEDVSFGGKHQP